MSTPEPTLAQAEEWARWAAVHDDWDKTRVLMGVLLAEYDRRASVIWEQGEEILRLRAIVSGEDMQ